MFWAGIWIRCPLVYRQVIGLVDVLCFAGWEMLTTDQGVVYYVDHINKRTCWDPPQMSSGGQSVLDTGRPDIRKHPFLKYFKFTMWCTESYLQTILLLTLLFSGVLALGPEFAIFERWKIDRTSNVFCPCFG